MGILENYREVLENVALAAKDAERKPESVTLVAVTKTHGAEKILLRT